MLASMNDLPRAGLDIGDGHHLLSRSLYLPKYGWRSATARARSSGVAAGSRQSHRRAELPDPALARTRWWYYAPMWVLCQWPTTSGDAYMLVDNRIQSPVIEGGGNLLRDSIIGVGRCAGLPRAGHPGGLRPREATVRSHSRMLPPLLSCSPEIHPGRLPSRGGTENGLFQSWHSPPLSIIAQRFGVCNRLRRILMLGMGARFARGAAVTALDCDPA